MSGSQLDLAAYLAEASRRIEHLLARGLDRVAGDAPPRLLEAMRYSLLGGGKRLRPALVLAAAQALGREASPAVIDFACALEFVHTYSLIHDDLPAMDDDDLRRGRPTSHRVFGEALAILAGDALLTDAFQLVAGGAGEPEHRLSLAAELAGAAGARGMAGGQAEDIAGEARTLDALSAIHARKTGALIRAAARGPALAPGTDARWLASLTRYGERLGVAFQIADDLLDADGSAEAAGKAVGKDAAKGRVGYPQLLGVEGARCAAHQAAAEARAALEGLAGDCAPLHALAEYAVTRDR